ncbi:MAG: succinylglutamate-semialdehyde dehydrogenase [Candidatus Melainabacteria bacterium]|nr:succinylglutamate-semialdehyde dehydrogenase [Candidatus Melainabacteria bacterium]
MSQFNSINPATGKEIWQGQEAGQAEIDTAVNGARKAFPAWSALNLDQRASYLEKFAALVEENQERLAKILTQDVGKALWEAEQEVKSPVAKLKISLRAYEERTGTREHKASLVRHKPHGVIGVFGPYNFPIHTPHGHIMPALLAGNTLVFKPSELTPYISEAIMDLWQQVNLPDGVMTMVQGKVETGKLLAAHPELDGIFFTGSSRTGKILHENYAGHPGKILALELGGNNPLLVHEASDIDAAAYLMIQSAFITAGQRCTCARRLIMVESEQNRKILDRFVELSSKIKIGDPLDKDNFMGPVISEQQAQNLLAAQKSLLDKGAKALLEMKQIGGAFVSPGIIDVTGLDVADEENFGPLLKVYWVKDWDAAIERANATEYGLSSGLLSDSQELYDDFHQRIRAGLVNWNNQITGASSAAPFGGIGLSGNHRPSAYYAADYCAYPVSSIESKELKLPESLSPGIGL